MGSVLSKAMSVGGQANNSSQNKSYTFGARNLTKKGVQRQPRNQGSLCDIVSSLHLTVLIEPCFVPTVDHN